jgi:hypothetical protein
VSLLSLTGYEDIFYEKWESDDMVEVECIFLEEFVEDPHIWMGNQKVADFLLASFHGIPFYFLSHFAWVGAEASATPVTIRSQPPAPWDGHQTLGRAVAAIRGAHLPILGLHLRTAPNIPFLHHVLPSSLRVPEDERGAGYGARCCEAFRGALAEHLACVRAHVRLLRTHRGQVSSPSLLPSVPPFLL